MYWISFVTLHSTIHTHAHTHNWLTDWLTYGKMKWNERETHIVLIVTQKTSFVLCSDERTERREKRTIIIAFHFSLPQSSCCSTHFVNWRLSACACVLNVFAFVLAMSHPTRFQSLSQFRLPKIRNGPCAFRVKWFIWWCSHCSPSALRKLLCQIVWIMKNFQSPKIRFSHFKSRFSRFLF